MAPRSPARRAAARSTNPGEPLTALSALLLLACHHRVPLAVPGAPAGCTAAFTLPADDPLLARARPPVHTEPGRLVGAEHGACVRLDDPAGGRGPWVIMVWEPGWQGELRCRVGPRRSPRLAVGPPDLPLQGSVQVKWYATEAAPGGIPTTVAPCPSGSPR